MADEAMRLAAEGISATPFEIPGATGEFRIQILNEDQSLGVVTTIVHLPPGGMIPAHLHKAGAEMHYVLDGDLIEAQTFQVLRMRLIRDYSGLWLLANKP